MICPRCDVEVKYGSAECPKCGLRFKYNNKGGSVSKCRRSTAAILCYLGGALGLQNFYLGYFVKGTVRLVIFLLFCGIFVSPQIANLISTGNFRITYDYFGVLGLVLLGVVIVSYGLCIPEFVHLLTGDIKADAKGLTLM